MRRSSNRAPSGGAKALLAALAALLAALPGAAAAPAGDRIDTPAEETWYVLELGGRPAGWALERRGRKGGRVVTEERMTIHLARGESDLEVSLAGRFEETAGGEPVSLFTRQELGSEPVETTYRFLDGGEGGIEAITVQGGRERRERLPGPEGDWLTPDAARRAVIAHHAAGDRRYEYRAIEPLEGPEPVTTTRTRLDEPAEEAEEADAAGGRWREETSSSPGVPALVELDGRGDVVRSSTEILGLEAVAYRSDRETALAAVSSAPGEAGPEVLIRTLVHPDRPIPGQRSATRAVYELSLEDGSPMPALPDGGAQRVEPRGERGDRVRVTVYRDPGTAPPPAPAPPPRPPDADRLPAAAAGGSDDAVTQAHLAASLYLDHHDPEVRRLLGLLRPPDADPGPPANGSAGLAGDDALRHASDLARFVHGYVGQKDLDSGFATASEVARTRRGDCTEHAVLLAALLRADGIPSRVVTGLVYLERFAGAEAIFGYHMWVQAALPVPEGEPARRWIDLDPTLPWGFDATHIALGHSDLSGSGRDRRLDRMLPLIGKLRIAVVEVASEGDPAR